MQKSSVDEKVEESHACNTTKLVSSESDKFAKLLLPLSHLVVVDFLLSLVFVSFDFVLLNCEIIFNRNSILSQIVKTAKFVLGLLNFDLSFGLSLGQHQYLCLIIN